MYLLVTSNIRQCVYVCGQLVWEGLLQCPLGKICLLRFISNDLFRWDLNNSDIWGTFEAKSIMGSISIIAFNSGHFVGIFFSNYIHDTPKSKQLLDWEYYFEIELEKIGYFASRIYGFESFPIIYRWLCDTYWKDNSCLLRCTYSLLVKSLKPVWR